MNRVGVIITDGVVINAVVWSDNTATQLANDGFPHAIEVTEMSPRPGIGWTWTKKDGFRPPRPFASWAWVGDTWVPPTVPPSDGQQYNWDEETLSWVEIPSE